MKNFLVTLLIFGMCLACKDTTRWLNKKSFDLAAASASVANRCEVEFRNKWTVYDCGQYFVGYVQDEKGIIKNIHTVSKENSSQPGKYTIEDLRRDLRQ